MTFHVVEQPSGLVANFAFEYSSTPFATLLSIELTNVGPQNSKVLFEVFVSIQATIFEDDMSRLRTERLERSESVF